MVEKRTEKGPSSKPDYPDSFETKQLFISSVITMSWQMALAILIPVLGGFFLDRQMNSSPLYTMIGLFIGVILVVLIVWRTIRHLPEYAKTRRSK